MSLSSFTPVRFGLFEFDPSGGELRRRGLIVKLTPQTRTLLSMLLEQPLRIRTRGEIQQRLWCPNTFVDFEPAMNKVVHSLREALGETARNPHFIETVANEGYRFIPQFVEWDAQLHPPQSGAAMELLAVLPILSEPEEELEGLSRRIGSSLTERLARMPGMRVMAASTVRSTSLVGLSPKQAAEQLGVSAVLAGELQRTSDGFLLRVELVDSADGALLAGAHAESLYAERADPEVALAQRVLDQLLARSGSPGRTRKAPKPVSIAEHGVRAS